MSIDLNKFYCESAGQLSDLPEGWDLERIDWNTRFNISSLDLSGEQQKLIEQDREFALKNGYHLVACGFSGTWPVEPEILSSKDKKGGVRVGYPGANDPYTCAVCGSPIRMII